VICRLKILKSERGLTLTELMISIAIISLIAGVCVQLVSGALDSWRYSKGKAELLNTARIAMERMVYKVRNTTWVLLPLMISDPTDPGYPASSYYSREVLAVSGNIDNDGDGLADEDPGVDLTNNDNPGIIGFDDDNDGNVDEVGMKEDDDEDGQKDEDVIDGADNDGDGRIDEDPGKRFYQAVNDDDDNDGTEGEDPFDPIIYYLNGTTLMERQNELTATIADNVIAENVSQFTVLRRRVNGNTLIDIYLKLDNGEDSAELRTTALARGMFKP